MTDDEKQELYSRIHPMHGRWNANHEGHDWQSRAIHPGAGTEISQCQRCYALKKTDGTTPPCRDLEGRARDDQIKKKMTGEVVNRRTGETMGRMEMTSNLPKPVEFSEAMIRQIAMDVGKDVVAHIEHAYPQMLQAVSTKSASLSIRNATYNAIMAAVRAADQGEVEIMLKRNAEHRRTMRRLRKEAGMQSFGENKHG